MQILAVFCELVIRPFGPIRGWRLAISQSRQLLAFWGSGDGLVLGSVVSGCDATTAGFYTVPIYDIRNVEVP